MSFTVARTWKICGCVKGLPGIFCLISDLLVNFSSSSGHTLFRMGDPPILEVCSDPCQLFGQGSGLCVMGDGVLCHGLLLRPSEMQSWMARLLWCLGG